VGHQLTVGGWVVGTAGGTAGGSVELSVTVASPVGILLVRPHKVIHKVIHQHNTSKISKLTQNCHNIYQSTIMHIPGLQEDNDQTAWLPISRDFPSFSSRKGSTPGPVSTFTIIVLLLISLYQCIITVGFCYLKHATPEQKSTNYKINKSHPETISYAGDAIEN